MLANYIDEIIMFCVGAWATAVSFGYLQMPAKDPVARQQWQTRYGTMFRWIGPILIAISVVLAISMGASAGGGG